MVYGRRRQIMQTSASDGPTLQRLILDTAKGDSARGEGLPFASDTPRRSHPHDMSNLETAQ
jgi:hypothetical protein